MPLVILYQNSCMISTVEAMDISVVVIITGIANFQPIETFSQRLAPIDQIYKKKAIFL